MSATSVLKDKKLLKSIAIIAIPIALQNLINYLTGMLDTVMLGQLGETALSGAAMANQFGNIFMGLTFGIASGGNILLSQYWGKGDTKSMHSILAVMYRVSLVLSLLFVVLGRFFPQQILSIFTNEPEVIAAGAEFLRVVCFSYLFNGIASVILMSLRSVGTVNISIGVYVTSMVCNGLLNYMFIFGKLGAPKLGIVGAAIATIIARGVECLIAVTYMLRVENKIKMTPRDIINYDHSFGGDFARTVAPVMLNELLWSLGSSMIMVVMGRLGQAFVAANSIANVTAYFVQVFIIGIGNAVAVIIGNIIGAEEYQRARDVAKGMIVLSAGLGVLAGGLLMLVRPVVVSFYNVMPSTKELAMDQMMIYALLVFFQSINFVSLMGILRGGGDTRFVLLCDVTFLWLFSIPLAFFVSIVLKWPALLVLLVLKSDEIIKSVVSTVRIWRGKWVRNVTRSEEP